MEPNTFIVGAYATSPNLYGAEHPDEGIAYDAEQEARFYSGLAAVPAVGGLEVQFDGKMHADEALSSAHDARIVSSSPLRSCARPQKNSSISNVLIRFPMLDYFNENLLRPSPRFPII